MSLELKINNNEDVFLSPIKKSEIGDKINIYELIDDKNNSWMTVELLNNSFKIINRNEEISDSEEILKIKLDQLVLEVIEAEQSGTENTESTLTEEASPYDPDKIKVHQKQFNVKLIAEMIDNEDIDFTPDFQRNFVWDSHQKSRLIESILLRIPLPMFYLAEDEEGRITVVDGLQRLSTIKDFMDNKFPLKGLQYLGETCNGRYYSDKNKDGTPNEKKGIDAKYFRWFNMTQFSVNVIDPSSPAKVKYDIFRRINTRGKPLNNQEIRNCLASKSLRETLKNMVSLSEFKSATDGSIKPTRMDDQEIALRFILFSKDIELNNYNGYMDSSLDDMTERLVKISNEDSEDYVNSFSNAMQNAEYLFGRKHAFRKIMIKDLEPNAYKQLLNKALFVCLSVLLSKYEPNRVKENNSELALLKPLAIKIGEDLKLLNYLSYGTNGKANLQYVFEEIGKLINENLKY
ncbi:hypothetical protein B0A58_10585 [Flavobacterium branchiophilum NBRC 15030 = ATCC 35035]|uniref:Uncharacterized protein DUF262 n=1 Tax=Flavobacterium branchiophilum TaxID=55197 RepID=A0A543G8B5_9FLAO|nr:DUF262 domain-containing protein [Flavobacterium branchiophilum]OXA74581.1 hypothetical protein B0A58_10585 [Flavobacterium branchiophilum NBRC 15030 = ATCC 35035]TQM42325.1 uncharacterized protein DUF262 [Flavobacterium branchiophilum]GEM55512.1 hypothetical protein FB1_17330 [Flavobacterium branchiophilum NBRC 15030 = ATCC 35035]